MSTINQMKQTRVISEFFNGKKLQRDSRCRSTAAILLLTFGSVLPAQAQHQPLYAPGTFSATGAVIEPAQQQAQHFAHPNHSPAEHVMAHQPTQEVFAPNQIQQVQLRTDPRRPLDGRIQSMPRAEQKLEVIHNRSQLIVTKDRIRRIAWSNPSILNVVQFSETEISLLGLEMGTTDLWLWFEGQENPLMYVVTVIRDPSIDEQRKIDYGRIERKLALLYPNSKVYLIPMSRKIIVRGQATNTEEAAKILQIIRDEVILQEGNMFGFDVGGIGGIGGGGGGGFGANGYFGNGNENNNMMFSSLIVDELQLPGEFQVKVRVRVAELNRSQMRRFGMDWSAIINNGAVELGQQFAVGSPVLSGIFDSGNVTVLVDALASNGYAKILDDSRIVTLSGEPAAFLAGGEFAVPTIVGIGGAQGQQTSFRGFGTSIIVTPTIVDNDLIRLQIVPEQSAINNDNAVGGIPGVNVRRVQTRVELREGQSIVLGGVFSRRQTAEVTRIPFLGELPLVGFVFNAKKATEDETEMLFVVTPEIVRPMDADQVPPLPGWYVTHPDDIDLYKYNRTEGNPDLGNYQLLPYGNGQGYGQDVGYSYFNPPPAGNQVAPPATGVSPFNQNAMAPGNYNNPAMVPGATYPDQSFGQPSHGQPSYAPAPMNGPIQSMPGVQYPSSQVPSGVITPPGPVNYPQHGIEPIPSASRSPYGQPSGIQPASATAHPGQPHPYR